MEYLTVELGLSANTRQAYERDLRLFCKTLGFKNSDALVNVSREQITGYMTQLKEKGLAAATIARKLAAIKAFYRFMTAEAIWTPTRQKLLKQVPKALSCRAFKRGRSCTPFKPARYNNGGGLS